MEGTPSHLEAMHPRCNGHWGHKSRWLASGGFLLRTSAGLYVNYLAEQRLWQCFNFAVWLGLGCGRIWTGDMSESRPTAEMASLAERVRACQTIDESMKVGRCACPSRETCNCQQLWLPPQVASARPFSVVIFFVKSSNRRAGGRALSLIRLDASGWPARYPSYGNAAYGWQEQALFASVPSAPSCEAMQLVTCIYWVVGPGMC